MRTNEFITEKSANWLERDKAAEELVVLFHSIYPQSIPKGVKKKTIPITDVDAAVKRAKQLLNIAGRATTAVTWGGYRYTSGGLFDAIVKKAHELRMKSGVAVPFPTGTSGTLSSFADQLALFFKSFGAVSEWHRGIVWSRSTGGKHKDPERWVIFNSEEERDEAWEIIQSKGKRVYIHDTMQSAPTEYIQVGKVLIDKNARRPWRDEGYDYGVTLQTTAITKNTNIYQVRDITDQEAARLRDIANTKNANALEKIQLIMALLKGEEDLKKTIDNSKKITPQDKAKLDAIIAGAANFKEAE